MERLTIRGFILGQDDSNDLPGYEAIYERLRQYENIGLTPKQLKQVDRLYAEKCEEVVRLRELQKEQEVEHERI